jgi:hypothetical protein
MGEQSYVCSKLLVNCKRKSSRLHVAYGLLITILREHRVWVYENEILKRIFATRRQQESSKQGSRDFPEI